MSFKQDFMAPFITKMPIRGTVVEDAILQKYCKWKIQNNRKFWSSYLHPIQLCSGQCPIKGLHSWKHILCRNFHREEDGRKKTEPRF